MTTLIIVFALIPVLMILYVIDCLQTTANPIQDDLLKEFKSTLPPLAENGIDVITMRNING